MILCGKGGSYKYMSVVFNTIMAFTHMMFHKRKHHIKKFLSVTDGIRGTIMIIAHIGVEWGIKDCVGHLDDGVL